MGELITLRENIIRRTGVRKRVGAKCMEILVRERGRKHRGGDSQGLWGAGLEGRQ